MGGPFDTLHHLSIVVRGAVAAYDDAAGLATPMRGRRADRSGFTLFDTATHAGGAALEVRSSAPPSGGTARRSVEDGA